MTSEDLLREHREAWASRWERADVVIDGDDELQHAVRFALFHLIGQVPDDGEAFVGARGLSGDAYRGHVFWDADVFVLPFLVLTHPAAARAMLSNTGSGVCRRRERVLPRSARTDAIPLGIRGHRRRCDPDADERPDGT